ncbi:hypothetical protein H8957_007577 [Semnopithecus entellus]
METSRSRGGGGAVSERGGAGASAGVCRRKAEAGAGTLAADMDLHCDCAAETPAAEPPSGKINKAAFKLFKKRKSGGTMPSIFGVKNKGDGKSSGPTGLVRSRTHDGLAEVLVLESGRLECVKEETPRAAREPEEPSQDAPRDPAGEPAGGEEVPAPADRAPARSCPEAEGPARPGDTGARGEDAAGHRRAEKPRGPPEPGPGEVRTAEDASRTGAVPVKTVPLVDSEGGSGRAPAAPDPASVDPPSDPSADRICLMFSDVTSLKSFDSLTGCGDIIADQEEEAGPSCDKHAPGPGKPALSKKNPGVVAYQGGGEEMASPDEVDDTYLQEFWDMLSQTEEQGPGPQEGAAKVAAALETKVAPETPKDTRCVEAAKDASSVKRRRLNRIPIEPHPKEEPKHPEKEQQEGVPNSDEGYWDSTTPGPEEDSSSSGKKAGLPRDSYSGDALYDLYADPDGSPATLPGGKDNEETSCLSRLKPVSPGTITCPLRTPGSLLKDSKIPISIKHLTNLPSSHPVVHQQPSRSEMPRTKIPVSKVLVRRVSNRGLAGTTIRATACHDSAKKV